jgi:hypothetical protein
MCEPSEAETFYNNEPQYTESINSNSNSIGRQLHAIANSQQGPYMNGDPRIYNHEYLQEVKLSQSYTITD